MTFYTYLYMTFILYKANQTNLNLLSIIITFFKHNFEVIFGGNEKSLDLFVYKIIIDMLSNNQCIDNQSIYCISNEEECTYEIQTEWTDNSNMQRILLYDLYHEYIWDKYIWDITPIEKKFKFKYNDKIIDAELEKNKIKCEEIWQKKERATKWISTNFINK